MLKRLEDDLLSRLSSAGGNLLGDTALVENLETTKRTAAEIEQKVMQICQMFEINSCNVRINNIRRFWLFRKKDRKLNFTAFVS